MRCVRALVQKLFRSAKPEKLENHHSLLQRLRCFLLLLSLRPTVAAIVASAVTRIVITRIALRVPVAKEARELRRGRSRLKQRYQTMPDPLHLHLFWLLPPLLPFPRWTLAPPLFCSFSVPRSRPRSHSRPSSRALTLPRSSHLYSLLVSILVNLLSPLHHDHPIVSHSLHHPCCHALAASPSLPHPRCPTLAASP